MKVKELKIILNKLDPELIVSIFDEDYKVYSDNIAIEESTLYTGEKRLSISKSLYPPRFFDQLKEMAEQDKQTNIIRSLLLKYFGGENYPDGNLEIARQKVSTWLYTANPLLGNLVPFDMIRTGRFEKLYSFVRSTLAENAE